MAEVTQVQGAASMPSSRPGRRLLLVALACGLLHAAASLYWAAGGEWLVSTVGDAAAEAVRSSPIGAAATLLLIGLTKATAAVVPLLAADDRIPWSRFWRAASLVGGVLVVLYGGLNTVVASAVLLGWTSSAGDYDHTAMLGHALLWDPLFLAWGLLLVAGLWVRSRATDTVPE